MNLSNIRPYRVENPSSRPPDPTLTLVIFCACDDYGKDGYPYRPLPYVCVVKPGTCILRRQRQISGARPDFHTCNFLCMRRLWLGWLLMRRRQVETSSDLGRPPDPTFCMYLSPVDTSINWPPARPSVVVKPGTCIMRRQRPISAARPDFLHVSVARRHIDKPAARPSIHAKSARTTARLWLLPYVCVVDKSKHGPIPAARPEPDFLHVSWLGWLLIPAASVCMRRRQVETWSDLGRLPDPTFCMYLSPVDTSINGPPARPSVHAKSARLAPPPDYGPAKQWVPYVFPMSCQLVTFVTFITAT